MTENTWLAFTYGCVAGALPKTIRLKKVNINNQKNNEFNPEVGALGTRFTVL